MHYSVLHLSDIHFKEGDAALAERRAVQVARASIPVLSRDGTLLAITGDLAFSGKAAEYDVATRFLTGLLNILRDEGNVSPKIAIVPGNHDCDFGAEQVTVRDSVLKSIADGTAIDPELVSACTVSVQKNFRNFVQEFTGTSLGPADFLDVRTVHLGQHRIGVLGYNSAWASQLNEAPASLPTPFQNVPVEYHAPEADIVLWMMHHPLYWMRETDRNLLESAIRNHASICLTGHEHRSGGSASKSLVTGTSVTYVEGGVLNDSNEISHSTFHVLQLDLEERTAALDRFTLSPAGYELEQGSDVRVLRMGPRNNLQLTQAFQDELEDTGASFTHRAKSDLRLSDIFVEPELEYSPRARTAVRRSIRLRDLLEQHPRVVLVGGEKSGKTALARYLAKALYEEGAFPVLISGGVRLRSSRLMQRTFQDMVNAQYGPGEYARYCQTPRRLTICIIDGFHEFADRSRAFELLAEAERVFSRVVVLSADDMRVETITGRSAPSHLHQLLDFEFADIIPLGHERRHDLISKWHALGGRELSADVLRQIKHAESSINQMLGKAMIPATPIHVLIMLQALEAGQNLDVKAGSQGYLFEYLVVHALSQISPQSHEIGALTHYLASFAWEFFGTTSRRWVDRSDVESWHTSYCDRELLTRSLDKVFSDLHAAQILVVDGDEIRFRHQYFECYFVAVYVAHNIARNHELKTAIRKWATEMHVERSASILLFLAHKTQDDFVLDTMLTAAERMYADESRWDGNSAIRGLTTLPALDLVLEEMPPYEAHREDARLLDEFERTTSPDEDIERVAPLNAAFKTIQILGQVLRSYYGAMDGERKLAVARACYELGLRLIGSFQALLEEDGDAVVAEIATHLRRVHPDSHSHKALMPATDATRSATLIVNSLHAQVAYTTIRHVAQSVGLEPLSRVYQRLRELMAEDEAAVAYALTEIAIQLEHFKNPPFERAIDMYEQSSEGGLTRLLLRLFVYQNLRNYPPRRGQLPKRHRVCAKLQITDRGLVSPAGSDLRPSPEGRT